MDSSKFDAFTKALATSTTRREALKTIAATTLGAILGLGGIGTAFAKCHNAGHNCDENSTCCSKVCCNGKCCAPGQVCQNGTCASPTTTTTPPPTTTTTPAPTTTTTPPPTTAAPAALFTGTTRW